MVQGYINILNILLFVFLWQFPISLSLLPGMEADDQEDTSYGGTKGDRDNSDFTQLESRSKDKAKVKTNYECSS